MKKIQIAFIILLFGITIIPLFGQTIYLTSEEQHDIIYMLEEEKLARDVYLTLGEKWEAQVFQNISISEERHISELKGIATRNNLTIPETVINDERGKFQNETLQNLYDELVSTGNQSLIDALKVGAKVEEVDIKDLEESIENTRIQGLKQIYIRLKNASENHLRAFVKSMKKQGLDYQPVLLAKADFDKIVSPENVKGACCSDQKGKATCKGEKGGNGNKACCSSAQKGKGKGCCSKPAG